MNFNKIFENWNKNILLQEDKLTDEIQQLKKNIKEVLAASDIGKDVNKFYSKYLAAQRVIKETEQMLKSASDEKVLASAKKRRKNAIAEIKRMKLYIESRLADLFSQLRGNPDFKYLGQGSFRAVFSTNNGSAAVLKVAKTFDALKQNVEESTLGKKAETRASEFYTKSFAKDSKGVWIIGEYVTPVDDDDDFEKSVANNFINFLESKGLDVFNTRDMALYKMALLYVSNFIKNKKVVASGIGNYEHLRFYDFYQEIIKKGIWDCQLDQYSEIPPEEQVLRALLAGNVCPSFEQFVIDAKKSALKDKLLANLLTNAMEYSGVSVWDIRPGNVGINSSGEARVLDASIELGDFTERSDKFLDGELRFKRKDYKPQVVKDKEEWERKKNDELLAQIRADNLARMEKDKQKLKQDPALVGATLKPGVGNKPSSDTKINPQFADTKKDDQEDPNKTKKAGIAENNTSWENDFSGAMKRFIYNNNQ
jgi:hypothetical protein